MDSIERFNLEEVFRTSVKKIKIQKGKKEIFVGILSDDRVVYRKVEENSEKTLSNEIRYFYRLSYKYLANCLGYIKLGGNSFVVFPYMTVTLQDVINDIFEKIQKSEEEELEVKTNQLKNATDDNESMRLRESCAAKRDNILNLRQGKVFRNKVRSYFEQLVRLFKFLDNRGLKLTEVDLDDFFVDDEENIQLYNLSSLKQKNNEEDKHSLDTLNYLFSKGIQQNLKADTFLDLDSLIRLSFD